MNAASSTLSFCNYLKFGDNNWRTGRESNRYAEAVSLLNW
jgi:hypothetical protein